MGKQIEFFMLKADEEGFLQTVSEANHLIVDEKVSPILLEDAINSIILSLYLISSNSCIFKNNSGFIDAIVSEAIQFSRCMNREEKVVRSGKLWAEFKYYDRSKQLTTKNKQFNDMYNLYAKWIKKNFKQSKCKNYYIGNAAYEKYKSEGYLMMAGPQHIVEFD